MGQFLKNGLVVYNLSIDFSWKPAKEIPLLKDLQSVGLMPHGRSNQLQFVPTELQQNPVSPKPAFIPTTGIKIYDEIGTAMINNPLNPPEPALVTKFACIGIGPGMTPSTQANDTM